MNPLNTIEREHLLQLRRAVDPSPNDAERNRQRLLAALAAPSFGDRGANGSAELGQAQASRRWWLRSNMTKLVGVAVLSGSIGVAAGYRWGLQEPRSFGLPGLSASAIPQSTDSRAGIDVTRSTSAPPRAAALPDEVVVKQANPTPVEQGADKLRAESLRNAKRTPGSDPSSTASAQAEDPLIEEMQLLRRAERAIRANNGLVALSLLQTLERRFPKGQLLEEREAASVMAHCETDPPDSARPAANRYLQRHPSSVYVDRVRALCQLSTAEVTESATSSD
ncbi:MAG TPA: hypothetical protein VIV60_17105 [Polyangiaceae bacterium]